MITGIICKTCYGTNATQVLRTGAYCAECYTYIMRGYKNNNGQN
jgi:hypothetical protein